MKAELVQDRHDPTVYRVEAIDEDGSCEVAVFSGPHALDRAIAFAGGSYYDSWSDPQSLAYYVTHQAPFQEGDIVRIKGADHLGLHRVEACEWFDRTTLAPPYWLCDCSTIKEPIDWSKIPAGSTGIVVGSGWRGNAKLLERVAPPQTEARSK